MKILATTLLIITNATCMCAQQPAGAAGVYSLRGVMETASGFRFKSDSTFEFFYSYGALDRYGSGTWSIQNNEVVLNSKPSPGKDFKLVKSALTTNKFITVKIAEKNPAFYRFVYCLVKTAKGDTLLNAKDNGIMILPAKTDSIRLLFELAPEKLSSFAVNSKQFNLYTFRFEPWIAEVFFKDFMLHYGQGVLVGKHPLLGEKEFHYEKEQ